MWFKPWTWRIVATSTVEPEFDKEQLALLVAYRSNESERGPHGVPMPLALDPKTKFEVDQIPTLDRAAEAVAKAKNKYYKAYPEASRDGHLWTVRVKPE